MKTIALTIGPIIETMSLGRKTSEIWAASYLFSSLMRDVLDEMRQRDGVEIPVPYVEDNSLFVLPNGGIGKFHDRFILRSDTVRMEEVRLIVDDKLEAIAAMMTDAISKRDKTAPDTEKVSVFLKSYIQPYLIETDEEDIGRIYALLDGVELHTPRIEGENYLHRFLRRDVILRSSMAHDAFGGTPSFDSIPAIAAQEDDEDIETNENFKNAYRYIAIVHADGDNMGTALAAAGSATVLSRQLFDFGDRAAQTLQKYGAQTLFIGGDDLLFFAPVLHKDGRTIFNLIDELSADFESVFKGVTTISFGVSITYYKYPLYEALDKSRRALFENAKEHPGKNAVAISVQKHSGQSFAFRVGKDKPHYGYFEMLLGAILDESSELPHSVHHKLSDMEPLIAALSEEVDDEGKPRDRSIEPLFDNFFNEELHTTRYKEGLDLLKMLMRALPDGEQETLFAMLSLIKLLRGDR